MFNGLQLTNKGLELLTNLLNGHNIQFTVIKMGDGENPSDISSLTDLVSVKQTLTIARNSVIDYKTMLIGANLFGSDVEEGFYWKEVGLFAKDLDGDNIEYLFSYDNSGSEASFIPKGGAVTEQLIDLNVVVGNVDNVTIEIDKSLVYATQDALDKAISNLDTTLTSKINTDISSVNNTLNTHINNKNNPHGVTKAQVGLGNVDNLATATEEEAKAGSANKFMTAANVKKAVEAYSVISDGNTIIKVGGSQPATQTGKTIIWIDTSS